ncbi:carbamoyltransferase HypF [Clostridium aquiflavi]|uniref:Carbamoyltransferase n=1 Tax=Clostridium aquiflavi TaxID=3073603 RepID=A0ABU1EJB5_9CLOT|nr:carbamoyltransferase HypF [Clostridium sp. 5N-1]MDR5588491.1 carbamoyltransferase HypF [Clostridium sp. 5N-1]
MIRKKIVIKGRVQGVGFRPFVYRIALNNNLKGYVKNSNKGVVIEVQGNSKNVENFLEEIKEKPPDLSYIDEIKIEDGKLGSFKEFKILESSVDNKEITLISPDIATCKECEKELLNINNSRRYNYAFINCTNCGPRFSIIDNLPYDRKNTSMSRFEMCFECTKEYRNPINRRFHAEPTCCTSCGPQLTLLNNEGQVIKNVNEIEEVKKYLKEGKIICVKGIGGFNLICNGKDGDSIEKLRIRKNRKRKPLALMMRDIDVVYKYCNINSIEEKILIGNKKPILLLEKKNNLLPYNISFNNKRLGVVLPYSPLHYLLFDNEIETIVFTSGNLSGAPIIYNNFQAVKNLKNICDYFLIHDRDINNPIDDAVTTVILNEERVIRLGRGYAPLSYKYSLENNILSLGSQFKNTFSLSCRDYFFTSPYIGDMDSVESIKYFEKHLNFIQNIYNIKPNIIAYDNHPNYWSNDFIDEKQYKTRKLYNNCNMVGVYHHHAHIVSCMFENNERNKVIGVAFDGVGYGEDDQLWGGEFLICDYKKFRRVGHIENIVLPSGDGAVKEPWKIGISLIYKAFKEEKLWCKENGFTYINNDKFKENFFNSIFDSIYDNSINKIQKVKEIFNNKSVNFIIKMIEKNINSPLTSSIGRLFDGVASILGFIECVNYEGEAALYLQNLAEDFKNSLNNKILYKDKYRYKIIKKNSIYIINTNKIILEILMDIQNNLRKGEIALKFHNTIIDFSYELLLKIREEEKLNTVALSGGVFQNPILLEGLYIKLKDDNFNILTHKIIPCNDSGLSIGQIIIANELEKV